MVRAALYARVSTHAGQDPEMQLLELSDYCHRRLGIRRRVRRHRCERLERARTAAGSPPDRLSAATSMLWWSTDTIGSGRFSPATEWPFCAPLPAADDSQILVLNSLEAFVDRNTDMSIIWGELARTILEYRWR